MIIKHSLYSILLLTTLASCGAPKTDNPSNTDEKVRIKYADLIFEDKNLDECFRRGPLYPEKIPEYADELKSLSCVQKGLVENSSFSVRSTKGLEHLTGLETLHLENQEIPELDVRHMPHLKTLDLNNTYLKAIDLSQNKELETLSMGLSFYHYKDLASRSLNLSSNTKLKNITAHNIHYVKLPNSTLFESLDLGFKGNLTDPELASFKNTNIGVTNKRFDFDLSNYHDLKQLTLAGQFNHIILPPEGKLITFNLEGSTTATIDNLMLQKNLGHLSIALLPTVETFDLQQFPNLNRVSINADGLKELNLSGLMNLSSISISGSSIETLSLDNLPNLADIYLDTPKVTEIATIDLTNNTSLIRATSNGELIVPKGAVAEKYESLTIQQLIAEAKIPDVRLASCIEKAAETEGVIYAHELSRLECVGGDGKQLEASMRGYASKDNQNSWISFRVFSVDGLEYFTKLKYIDLSGNWLDSFDIGDYPPVETLILDDNVIQNFYAYSFSALNTLSLNGNPLKTVYAPSRLRHLHANSRIDWWPGNYLYLEFVLNAQYDTPRLKDSETAEAMTQESYSAPFTLTNRAKLLWLEELDSDKLKRF